MAHTITRLVLRWSVLLLVLVPLLAWFLVKPVRVVAPTQFGVTCTTEFLCVDDVRLLPTATALHANAMVFISIGIGAMPKAPKFIFCSTEACAQAFGLGERAAVTVGSLGTVVSPRGWKSYYVRHEMIHVLQAEKLGVIPLLFTPAWFKEGMAYALSADPRAQLDEPYETHRRTFQQWFSRVNKAQFWELARKL